MARNANGIYSLVSGNPVITGTVIESDWANTTMPDIGNEITDSLSRSGKGGMLASLRGINGTKTTPTFTFTNSTTTGLYLATANSDLRLSVFGVDKFRLTDGDTKPEYWDVGLAAWVELADAADITTNATNITTNATNITTNATNIATNTAAIFGAGQTLQDVTGSRSVGVNYTNTDPNAILVCVSFTAGALNPAVNGVSAFGGAGLTVAAGSRNGVSFAVPSGAVYSIAAGATVDKWTELKL